ncbi:hypothetical protein ElyMa_006158900 [Elysia marginata]|uniref:Apple domain-containing protein n=1 Tax=Elysia marginata TaxID=1093978 RepID=A0AAV4H0F1_9GAST|nr:hypothetical protein ElyMa_006158900 [Elysia marginata]
MFRLRQAWLFSALVSISVGISNFFSFKSPSAWNNEAWGRYTFSFADYAPTCGWKLIVSSSYYLNSIQVMLVSSFTLNSIQVMLVSSYTLNNIQVILVSSFTLNSIQVMLVSSFTLNSIQAWDSSNTRFDERTFLIHSLNYNADLVTNTQWATGGDITLYGTFGNTEPDVYITWYCVCTNAMLGCQNVPYLTVAPWDATPAPATTTAEYVTTESPDDTTQSPPHAAAAATTAPPPAPATAAPAVVSATAAESGELYVGFNVSEPTKIFLQKQSGLCYAGVSFSRHFYVRHVHDCQALCRANRNCAAVNYWYNALACDEVLEDTALAPGTLTSIYPGCHYWKVVWKA